MKKNGGSAFPFYIPENNAGVPGYNDGMSLRDYFAGQALLMEVEDDLSFVDTAEDCYKMADAMLEARTK